ncbi:MAG: LysR family transcriptional regulator [Burkholderiaceae bacterium]|nr:LysR family transcriptional regulator [Burkholderiaceae bacterium]
MRLRHIEVFHAIMQAGTITGAAQILHISQPAVTKVLQHCELQLGLPLFNRVRGKLYPTPEAQRLRLEIDKLNKDLVSIRRLASNLRTGEFELLRLVSTPALGISVLPSAIAQWCAAYPNARCTLATHHTREIISALLLNEADLALSLHDPCYPGIVAEPLAAGMMMALCPLNSPEGAVGGALKVADIRTPLIAIAEGDPLGNLVMGAFESEDLHPQSRITVQTYQLARSLVEAGAGMTVVDPFTAAAADHTRVRVRALEPSVPVQLYLLTAVSSPPAQSARRLVKFLGETARASLATVGV